MFRFLKKQQKPTTVERVEAEVCPTRVDVPDTPADTVMKDTTKPCWYQLFGRSTKKKSPEEEKQSDITDTNAAPKQKVKKPGRCCQWWKKKNRVTPAASQDEVEVVKNLTEGERKAEEDLQLPEAVPGNNKKEVAQELEIICIETAEKEEAYPLEPEIIFIETTKKEEAYPLEPEIIFIETAEKEEAYPLEPEIIIINETPRKQQKKHFDVITSDDTSAAPKQKVKKPWRLCQWWKKKNRVTPAASQEVVEIIESLTEEDQEAEEDQQLPEAVPENNNNNKKRVAFVSEPKIIFINVSPSEHHMCFGFPNQVKICYMNSCLQSLLTLVDFVGDINRQEQIWSLDPETTLIQAFIDIQRNHGTKNRHHKLYLLSNFHKAVSMRAPEFQDFEEKDSHEFLIAVLDQIRWRDPELKMIAAAIDTSYSCPVVDNMLFRMQNIRTCKSCGAASTREEEFTNLSLDLLPKCGTVEQIIEDYQKETLLEYQCSCGANMSGQHSSFINLPKVLILHLKRFRFTSTYKLRKSHDPVTLQRDIVVSSNQGACCYSLVSIISHIGTARNGHYISDGVDPYVGQGDPIDRWYTYNDSKVFETSGDFVCKQRDHLAYILFYKKQE